MHNHKNDAEAIELEQFRQKLLQSMKKPNPSTEKCIQFGNGKKAIPIVAQISLCEICKVPIAVKKIPKNPASSDDLRIAGMWRIFFSEEHSLLVIDTANGILVFTTR